jgi:RNA polymerase sigma-70 factor (ECF subfamily)
MQQLPEGYRVVLTLRLIEELDYPEIAEMLDINESSVRSQFTRGRQKLVELLKRN